MNTFSQLTATAGRVIRALGLLLALFSATTAQATEYQSADNFLREVFAGAPPSPKVIWLNGPVGQTTTSILGHPPTSLRSRYWLKDGRSAWILEEIGKEKPITVGLVVNQGRLEQIKVLAFREIRGDEVRHDFFTRQFKNASLKTGATQLDRPIDGISGATMSVSALTRLARLALYLHSQTGS